MVHTDQRRLVRILTVCLGGFWLLDGILQLQPAMFTSRFVNEVLAPNLTSQPDIVANIVAFGIRLWSINMLWFNLIAAFIQFLISALLILPLRLPLQNGAVRLGLWLSIAWALVIWIFGEGFGGLATGSASFYTGAPGSALLYIILALFLLNNALNECSEVPLRKLPVAAGMIFLAGAVLNLVPIFWTSGMLSVLVITPALSGPLSALGAQGTMIGNLIAVDTLICLGVFLILTPNRLVAWITIIFLLGVWLISQNLGGLQTFPGGIATDPNSAPFLILFLLPIFFIKTSQAPS